MRRKMCIVYIKHLKLSQLLCDISLVFYCPQKEYRKEYEDSIRGKALVDVDLTPGYITARNATSLISDVRFALNRTVCSTHLS